MNAPPAPGRGRAPPLDAVVRAMPWIVVGYFALQAVIRTLMPGGLGIDEAEQRLLVQSLDWGYGAQPPLYTWLQAGVLALTGPGKLGYALLKNACLAGAVLGAWWIARHLSCSARAGAVAVVAMLLMPQFSWEAQRSLSHTPLAVAAVMAVVALALRLAEAPGPLRAAALALAVAAAALAKFNALFVVAALPVAVALTARHALGWCLAALALAALLVAPSAFWALENADLVTNRVRAFGLAPERGPLAAALAGGAQFVASALLFLALAAAALGAAFAWVRPTGPAPVRSQAQHLATAILALATLAALWTVMASGATTVKERWLQPVLVLAAPVAAAWLSPRLSAAPMRWLMRGAGVLALVLLLAVPANLRLGGGNPSYQMLPFGPIAARLAEGPPGIFVSGHLEAGNLLYHAPNITVLIPRYAAQSVAIAPPVQLVWRGEEATPPEALIALFERRFRRPPRLGPAERLEAPFLWPHEGALVMQRVIAE